MGSGDSPEPKRELIVICGPPASGKTTLADRVSTRTGFLHLSSDHVGRAIVGQLSSPFPGKPDEVFRAARGAMFAVWQLALPMGIGCIHDATVPHVGAWKDLRDIADRAEARLSGIILDAPDWVLLRRASARTQTVQVRPFNADHLRDESKVARETYANYVPSLVDRTLRLDTQARSPDDLCAEVLEFLDVRD